MEPEVGSYKRAMHLPRVDFPQPDSPTRPRVSPGCISKEIPSTALLDLLARRRMPSFTGKCILRSVTLSIGALFGDTEEGIGLELLPAQAADLVLFVDRLEFGGLAPAWGLAVSAAVLETATFW